MVKHCFYIFTDAPLTTENAYQVVRASTRWKQFCRYLHIPHKLNKRETLKFYMEEPYFEACWVAIALALYQIHDDESIDILFHYMKSPAGEFTCTEIRISYIMHTGFYTASFTAFFSLFRGNSDCG